MPVLTDHVIEGNLTNGNEIDFTKEHLAVHAFVKGEEVAQTKVDTTGHFKVTFASDEERPLTELRVTPADTAEGTALAAAIKLDPMQFSVKEHLATAQTDLHIASNVLDAIRLFGRPYEMFGTVFGQTTFTIEPVPALKMDFYEFSWNLVPFPRQRPVLPGNLPFPANMPVFPRNFILPKRSFLGTTFTDPQGKYDFNFRWSFLKPWLLADPQPDVFVRISQFFNGAWNEIFRGPVDWNIIPRFHRDFLVPVSCQTQVPAAPATGFLFSSIGLIPVDKNHLIKGYAFTDMNDPQPIANMTHRPFALTLRINGRFAKTPQIASYKVQFAPVDENFLPGANTTLAWKDVVDPLANLKWNPATHIWEHKMLGPDPVTHRFLNIENESDWFEPALKFTFASNTVPDGFYAFRMIGFDAAGNQTGAPVEMPALCIDNTVPVIDFKAPKAQKCGAVELEKKVNASGETIHTLDLAVTGYDSAGHVLGIAISATRGAEPLMNDGVIKEISPSLFMPVPGPGLFNKTETLIITDAPEALADCETLSYNFLLGVLGSATDGYSRSLGSQYVQKSVNLMVKKP